jgi:hypothetical protein
MIKEGQNDDEQTYVQTSRAAAEQITPHRGIDDGAIAQRIMTESLLAPAARSELS